MGVAGLFSFLRRRYPEIVEACAQQAHELAEGETSCDNLYIDLNHIIHACTHPSWREQAHVSELEQFMECDVYLDRLVALMRPTRLLVVAADGSAPTAKMNQQRGRRFYAAHLEQQRRDIEAQVRREMAAEMGPLGGADIPDLPNFDGNVITPGTGFMARLGDHLREFLRQKLESDPDWAHLAVIFSDSSEPGEGEHKIMRFIRQQRTRPDYDPNTRHAIYGQDADLILLGLLSHEPHFCILRESGTLEAALEGAREAGDEGALDLWSPVGQQPLELLRLSTLRDFLRCEFADYCGEGQGQPCTVDTAAPPAAGAEGTGAAAGGVCGAQGSRSGSGTSSPGGPQGVEDGIQEFEAQGHEADPITGEQRRVHPLAARRRAKRQQREAAAAAAAAGAVPAPGGVGGSGVSGNGPSGASKHTLAGGSFDFERILDDVVFCTFLAGNDFLPHVPSLDIYDRPSALDTLLGKYKEMLDWGRGYLTASGHVNADKLCWLFQRLGAEEEATFQQRELRKVREQRRKLQQEAAGGENGRGHGPRGGAGWMRGGEWVSVGELRAGCSLDEALAGAGSGDGPGLPAAALWADDPARLRRELLKRVRARMDDRAQAGMAADQVRLSLPGYRARYYQRCFGAEAAGGPELEKMVRRICAAYCRTLCWVNFYYKRGTPPAGPAAGNGCASAAGGEEVVATSRRDRHGRGADSDAAPYASWQVFYEHHYAPLASDLARYGREALRGAAAAASRPDAPIPPFAQLLSVLPFSSMPACLPQRLAAAAVHPSEGLAALHGPAGRDVFPNDVAPLVDLSGKKWAHTAVVALPFPDVNAVCGFVAEQLEGEEGCRMSEAERTRNRFAPALLLLPAFHPLAQQAQQALAGPEACSSSRGASPGGLFEALLLEQPGGGTEAGDGGEAAAVATAGAGTPGLGAPPAGQAEGGSIMSLLLPGQRAAAGGDAPGVLCLALDIAGQAVPPFSPGLLPGTQEGERAVTMQSWNKRRLDEQRRQAARAAAGLRGGRGRGSGRGSSMTGRGPGAHGAATCAVQSRGGSSTRGGIALAAAVPPSPARSWLGSTRGLPVPLPPSMQALPVPPPSLQPAASARRQQELLDEELARCLQEQFDAEALTQRQAAAANASCSTGCREPLPGPGPSQAAAPGGDDSWAVLEEEGTAATWRTAGSAAPWPAGQAEAGIVVTQQAPGAGELPPWLAAPLQPPAVQAVLARSQLGPTAGSPRPAYLPCITAAGPPASSDRPGVPECGTGATLPPSRAPGPAAAAAEAASPAASEGEVHAELDDMLALLGVQ